MKSICIIRPDDWHCHLRDGEYLTRTVPDVAARFHRAVIMPNLKPPVTSFQHANDYRHRILHHVPKGQSFTPLMTLYLTESMPITTIEDAARSEFIPAAKLYPAGATTHSAAGVKNLEAIYPLLEAMQKHRLLLLIHGESIDPSVDIFDREAVFIEKQLDPLIRHFPSLRIVLEHISTKIAVDYVRQASNTLAATITPHHLLFDRNVIFKGGIRPHYYCLPILKRAEDRYALIQAATSGESKFFLGTDSAPHAVNTKETACGCAGIYSSHAAIEIYASIFEQQNALDKLEAFASINGANFYGLPVNTTKITLRQQPWQVSATLTFGQQALVPLLAEETVAWQLQ